MVAVALGAAARLAWVLLAHPPWRYVYSDMEGYVSRALTLATGGDLTRFDAFYPPGAHVLLSLPLRIVGTGDDGLRAAGVLWAVIAASIPYLTWRLVRRLAGAPAGAVAAVLAAVWPFSFLYGGYFLSELPALALLLGALVLGHRMLDAWGRERVLWAALTGLTAGAAIAVRPQLVANVAVLGAVVLWRRRPVVAPAGAMALAMLLPIGGAVALNSAAAGNPTGLSENGGFNFFQGQCEAHTVTTGNPEIGFQIFASPVPVQQERGTDFVFPHNLASEQDYFFARGWECVRANGWSHVGVVARNIGDLGASSVPWPMSADARLEGIARVANVVYVVLFPTIVIGAALRARRGPPGGQWVVAVLLLHVVCVLPTGAFFYGDPRFRVPYDVFGLALAAVAAVGVSAHHKQESTPPGANIGA